MTTNAKIILGVLGLTILLTVIVWVFISRNANEPEQEAHEPDKRQVTPEETAQIKKLAKKLDETRRSGDASEQFKATQELARVIGGKAGAMLEMAAARNLDVEFYGRVLDQDGRGVSGAKVQIQITGGGTFAPGTGRTEAITDAEGHFKASGKGQSVTVMGVEHPEVSVLYFRNRHDGRRDRNLHLKATDMWGDKSNWRFYDDRSNPLEIRVWRNTLFEKVTVKKGTYHIPVNGERIILDGRLKVACVRDVLVDRRDYGDWSVSLTPTDGGIQETEDLYLNEAPLNGYQPTLTIGKQVSENDYTPRIVPAKRYYFTTGNRATYGSLEIAYEPFAKRDKCTVLLTAKFNLKGSRNLAMKN